jgi:PAS domain S-box-containing protein
MTAPAHDLFRTLAEHTYDWETWVDSGGVVRWVNPAVERITGHAAGACLAMPDYPLSLAHPADRALLAHVLEEAARGHSGNDVEFRVITREGESRWVAISYQAVQADDGTPLGYRTSVRDIDERKRMESELHDMRRRAEAAAIARAELLANVSHELRTPAHCIAGFTELLLAGETEPARRRQLELIADQCASMQRQVEDLLELAALEAGGVRLADEAFDLAELCHKLVEAALPVARERGVSLHDELEACPRRVVGDAHRVHQVLRNLLDNALKFTERGEVRLAVCTDAGGIRCDIIDTGLGFPPGELERLLQPFEQADARSTRRRGGAGLGLSICRRLVQAMSGQLRFESVPGQGTTVHVWLPLVPAQSAAAVDLPAAHARPGCALVVDDSAVARELLRGMLELEGWSVREASSGETALKEAARAELDLVLLDYQMPDGDGAEAAVALRRWFAARRPERRTPIFLLTANVFVREQLVAARHAIDGIVSKPLSRAALAHLLAAAADLSTELLDERVVGELASTRARDGRSMLARVLGGVAAELPASLQALRAASDRAAAARAAHAIAGQALLVGARQLAQLARQLEDGLEVGAISHQEVNDQADQLERAWQAVASILQRRAAD